MRVGLAQINTVTGDIGSNVKKVLRTLEHAASLKVDLVIFPEMTLTGYPPRDLLDMPAFVDESLRALVNIAAECRQIAAIVGHVERSGHAEGKPLFNAASLLSHGTAKTICRKTLLPTYDVFDEARWFQPGTVHTPHRFGGWLLGTSICEDIWNNSLHHSHRLYDIDPIERLVTAGAEALINIGASPYQCMRRQAKTAMLSSTARRHGRPLIVVNQVGGNDSLIFDGGSAVFDAEGQLVHQAPHFRESFDVINLDGLPAPIVAPEETIADIHSALVLGLRDYVRKCGFKKVLVGLSGGIDSAVTCALAVEALGSAAVTGVTMPSVHSSTGSVQDSRALAQNLAITCHTVPIPLLVDAFGKALVPVLGEGDLGVTDENIQARVRGVILMAISNQTGALLLTTGNKSELAVGYCTLYGDMAGGLAVISDVPKTMVYELAHHINRHREVIPQAIIDKPPSAELRPGQKDTDSLPPYDILDPIMRAHVEEHLSAEAIIKRGYDGATVRRILRLIAGAEYKRRQAPPGLRVTSKAFGEGWRMPIARGKH
ncbi:NAD+ synthase [Candidatus Sumerlaeota bacterium]|nr:NAD+ synthase [Candidatus Sumerlaeota bacterium]